MQPLGLMKQRFTIARSFSIVAGFTLLSSVLGYVRDAALAARFGASAATDAYFAAFFVPNTLYLILVAGSLSAAFIPVFVGYLGDDSKDAWRVASSLFNVTALGLGALVLVFSLTTKYWIALLFPGFQENTSELAVQLSFVLLPMLLFVGMSSLTTAVLNSLEHFTAPALAPIISNVIVIAAIVLSGSYGGIHSVAVGVLIGMLVQLLLQLPVLSALGGRYHLEIDLRHPAILRIGKLALPLFGYLMVAYASIAIERTIASTLPEGTISALNYAMRLFVLPTTILAGSLATVIYPRLSAQATGDDPKGLSTTMSNALGVSILVLTPMSLWMILNGSLIVQSLFGHGRFRPEDIQLTSTILSGYAVGIVPLGITGILQKGFFALQNTTGPLLIEIANLAFYTGLAVVLAGRFGPGGLSTARGLSMAWAALASIWLVRRYRLRLLPLGKGRLSSIAARYFLCCVFPVVIWGLPIFASQAMHLPQGSGFGYTFVASISGAAGLTVYLVLLSRLDLDHLGLLPRTWAFLIRRAELVKGGCLT